MGSRLPIEITRATPAAMAMLWEALCVDPQLADLPYKVETNERGQLLMSPAGTSHSRWQARVTRTLGSLIDAAGLGGEVLTECAVLTALGIKVPDVAWISAQAWSSRTNQSLLMVAPEICIEVMSPSNTAAEMADKAALYSASGANEVWILDASGQMRFLQPHRTSFQVFRLLSRLHSCRFATAGATGLLCRKADVPVSAFC